MLLFPKKKLHLINNVCSTRLKKLVSIFFLLIFLFNAFGYLVLFLCLQLHYSSSLKQQLDISEYSGSDAMIAKIPLSLPYPVNFDGYERVDGQFECNGEVYKLVKQNLVNDTLYIVFVKDKKGSALNKSLADFVKQTGEPLSKTASKLIDFLGKQVFTASTQMCHLYDGWCLTLIFTVTNQSKGHQENSVITPPPKIPFT